jgi:exopolysaccharide biosynthesis polyprenyl glycosylphosphotransferase
MNISRKRRQYFIAFVDIILLVIAIYLSLWIRDLEIPFFARFLWHIPYFIPVIAVWIVCLYTAGFYSLEIPRTGYRTLTFLSIIAVICVLLGFAFFYLNNSAKLVPKPKTILVIYGLINIILIAIWRWLYNRITLRYFANTNIAVVGINNTVVELLQNMRKFSYMNYKIQFLYMEKSYYHNDDNVPIINDPVLFVDEIKKNKIQLVVVADKENLPQTMQNVLFELLRNHIYFIDLPDFYEIYMRQIPLDAVSELWFLANINLRSKIIYRLFKRAADIIMAFISLLITLPFWPLIIMLIKLDSSGPAFFKQVRIGYLEKQFTIIKFRTMCVSGNSHEPTATDDSRVTGIGKFLRRTRIDEIPQFLNVLKSDMSFIGPRPERPELIQKLEKVIPFYRQRLLVKPGLSGWDQVSGEYHSPSQEDTYKKLQYDLYYIKNMSFFLDVSIFFKTLVTMVNRGGV